MPGAPKPAPKPGRVKVYRALYDYSARSEQEMTFSEGDLLFVSDKGPNDDWLPAMCEGRKGLVPVNYVASDSVEELLNPLHEAAKRGNISFLKQCLANQVSVNSLDKSGSTALYWAAHGGHLEILKHLLTVPNVTVTSQGPIMLRYSNNVHVDCRLGQASWSQSKPQYLAICARIPGSLYPVRNVLGSSVSLNKIGDTPLHAASWKGHKDCAELLLANGSNPWIKNLDGKLPLDVAKDVDVAAVVKQAMQSDMRNEECENEYESGSDHE